jgi:hypothetical protein
MVVLKKEDLDYAQSDPLLPGQLRIRLSEVTLWCDDPHCESEMLFEPLEGQNCYLGGNVNTSFIYYCCKHCETSTKLFAVLVRHENDSWQAAKIGEYPPYSPPVPARVQRLVQEDRELFLQGQRSESLGLGIGAYTYYRRVIENHKNRLFDQIIATARKLGANSPQIERLEKAKSNYQFNKSVEEFKDALPVSLLVNGQNPLTLLHAALSGGVHNRTDDECLELARDIRIVLTELAVRISDVLRETREVNDAVTRLVTKGDRRLGKPSGASQ